MTDDIPARGLAIRSEVRPDNTVRVFVAEVDVPRPAEGQVLVKVEAAPVNPSDLGLLFAGADLSQPDRAGSGPDRPEVTLPLPPPAARAAAARLGQALPAGNEGAGTVVATGPDPESAALNGRVVAVAGGAMYAQYRLARTADCLVMPPGVSARDAASSFVNPMTVLGMVETMRAEGHHALVHTAAASNLGQMLQKVCAEEAIPLVNVVRSEAQVRLLRDLGATWICDSSGDDFMSSLTAAVRETSATLAFDAIGGGTMASRILTAMEAAASADAGFNRYGSSVHKQVYIYGGLDRGPTELTRGYGMAWGVGGWLLTPFLQKAGAETVRRLRERVAAGITTTFASTYTGALTLVGMVEPSAIRAYGRQATGQKHLLLPHA